MPERLRHCTSMEREMPAESQDATLAVVVDRLDRMQRDLVEHRDKTDKNFEKLESDLAGLTKSQAETTTKIAKAEGGYMILLGLGSVLVAIVTLWDKLWGKTHG